MAGCRAMGFSRCHKIVSGGLVVDGVENPAAILLSKMVIELHSCFRNVDQDHDARRPGSILKRMHSGDDEVFGVLPTAG
jgi:hypothetical protein